MRASKQKRQLLRSVRSVPKTAFGRETEMLERVQYRMGPISGAVFAGGAVSIYAKRKPKEPTGQQFPLSMFVKNDTTGILARAKERRQAVRASL